MEYESTVEKTTIIPKRIVRSLTDDVLKRNPQIRNIRRKLIVLLSIELVVMVIYLILQIVSLILHYNRNDKIDKGILMELFITIISIVYLIAFIIVITQYFPIDILIFVYLTLIQLIGGSILLILAIMGIVTSLSLINNVGTGIIIDIIFIIVAVLVIILSVLIILSSLNLMKLIKI